MQRRNCLVPDNCRDAQTLPAMLTVKESAKFARVSERVVRDAVLSGELKSAKMGRIYRIPKVNLLSWTGITQ